MAADEAISAFTSTNQAYPKRLKDQLVKPPRKEGTTETSADEAPALAVAEPRGRTADAQGGRRRTDSPCNRQDGAESATSRGSETTRQIKAKYRLRFCPEHMKSQSCQREVSGGKCSKGLYCTSGEADPLKDAAKAAVKAEIAAKR